MKKRIACLIALFFFSISIGFPQSDQGRILLEKGHEHSTLDNIDSARYYYQQALDLPDRSIRLMAVASLLKIATNLSEHKLADSLLETGDRLNQGDVSLESRTRFHMMKAEYLRRISKFDEALALNHEAVRSARMVDSDPLLEAQALKFLGSTHEKMGTNDSSLIYIERAYQVFKRELDSNDVKMADVYNHLGVSYYRNNRYEESKKFYLKSKRIAEEQIGYYSQDMAIVLSNLANISQLESNYEEAVDYIQQAKDINTVLKDENGLSYNYYSLGVLHHFMGDHGRTLDYTSRCLEIREKLYEPGHYMLSNPLQVLGITYQLLGEYERSLEHFKRAIAIDKKNYGAGSAMIGYNLENIALLYQYAGELDSALYYINQANQIFKVQLPELDFSYATHNFSYASILNDHRKYVEAGQHIERALGIMEGLGLQNTFDCAQMLGLQADLLSRSGKWEEADSSFFRAMAIVKPQGEYILVPATLSVIDLYINYLHRRYDASPGKGVIDRITDISYDYLAVSNSLRNQFHDAYSKSAMVEKSERVFRSLTSLYTDLYFERREPALLAHLYTFVEQRKAVMLRDMLDENITRFRNIPDNIVEKERSFKKDITDAYVELQNDPGDSNRLHLLDLKEEFDEYIREVLSNYPGYFNLKYDNRLATLQDVRDQLREGETVIEYFQDDSFYYAFVITGEDYGLYVLPAIDEVDKSIQAWREAIASNDPGKSRREGQSLYAKLWAPFADAIEGTRILIVPSGPLYYLSFEALPDPDNPGSWLVGDHNISYALSMTVYLDNSGKKGDEGILLSLAPGFEPGTKDLYSTALDSLEIADREYLGAIRQPWSLRLANKISRQYKSIALTGLDATERNLKSNLGLGSVLHFATHGIANTLDPMRSRIFLTKEADVEEDGYLHAYELFDIRLNADLAILGACETGIGALKSGEGMVSLAYGMKYAGCPSTVMTLWKVDERTVNELTEMYIDFLSRGKSKSEALWLAKKAWLDKADPFRLQPFFWSGMVLMGQDGTVDIAPKYNWTIILSIGTILLLIMLFVGIRILNRNRRSVF